jgi:hypothetical protein
MPVWAWLLALGAAVLAVLAALAIRHYPDDNSF